MPRKGTFYVCLLVILVYPVIYRMLNSEHRSSLIKMLSLEGHSGRNIKERAARELPYVYKPPEAAGVDRVGKKFGIDPEFIAKIGLPPGEFFQLNNDTVRDFVFVTAADTRHMVEMRDCVASIQLYFPGYDIHLYDIGMTEEEVSEVRTWCDVYYHLFDIPMYPKHVRIIRQKAFKFLVIQDILRQYGAAFWVDASFRATEPIDQWGDIFSLALQNGGIVMTYNETGNKPLTNYAFSDPRMFEFLPTDVEIQKELIQQCSCAVLIYNTEFVFRNVLWWMYLCSLEHDCIHRSPGGSKSDWSRLPPEVLKRTLAIHKYDQAALNTILGNYFGYDQSKYTTIYNHHTIIREPSSLFTLSKC